MAVEGQEEPAFARRLVFTEISSLIQSEARLVACKPESSGLAEKTPAKNGKKGAKKAQAIGSELPQLELDDTVLAMDYHKQIVAGLLASKQHDTLVEPISSSTVTAMQPIPSICQLLRFQRNSSGPL